MRRFVALALLPFIFQAAPVLGQTEKRPSTTAPRQVFVLHAGLHTILSDPEKNIAALSLRDELIKRGIKAGDIIVLDNPFPNASWTALVPWQGISMFLEYARPGSRESQAAYLRMHRALQANGVRPEDDLIWIGHSAGGQIGLTMAHMSRNLQGFPDLARSAMPYRFEMVITLGAPVALNLLPPNVKFRYYYSPQDQIVRWAATYGSALLHLLGHPLGFDLLPPSLQGNSKVRIFAGVEHPYWDCDPRVIDRIVADSLGRFRPLWRSPFLTLDPAMAMARLMYQALDEFCNISLEDPPSPR